MSKAKIGWKLGLLLQTGAKLWMQIKHTWRKVKVLFQWTFGWHESKTFCWYGESIQFSSVAQSFPTLCDPMDCISSLEWKSNQPQHALQSKPNPQQSPNSLYCMKVDRNEEHTGDLKLAEVGSWGLRIDSISITSKTKVKQQMLMWKWQKFSRRSKIINEGGHTKQIFNIDKQSYISGRRCHLRFS